MLDFSIFGWYLMVYDFSMVVLIKGILEFSKYYKDCLRDEILQKIEFEGNSIQTGYCIHCKTFTYQHMTFDGFRYNAYDRNSKMYFECMECEKDASGYITKDKV